MSHIMHENAMCKVCRVYMLRVVYALYVRIRCMYVCGVYCKRSVYVCCVQVVCVQCICMLCVVYVQPVNNRQQPVNNRQQADNNRQQADNSRQQADNSRQQADNNRQQAVNNLELNFVFGFVV